MNKPQKPDRELTAEESLEAIKRVATQVGMPVGQFKRKECFYIERELGRIRDNDLALKSNIRDLLRHYDNKSFADPGFKVLDQSIRKWCGMEEEQTETVDKLLKRLEEIYEGRTIGDDIGLRIIDTNTLDEVYYCDCSDSEGEYPGTREIEYYEETDTDFYGEDDIEEKPGITIYIK